MKYMQHSGELRINDKEYVAKIVDTLSKILNKIPVTNNDYDINDNQLIDKKKKNKQESNEIFECIWNEHGFTRGAIILQGLLIKLDKNHCLKPHLQRFCVNEFSKLTQYGLLEPETDEKATMLLNDKYYNDTKQTFLPK